MSTSKLDERFIELRKRIMDKTFSKLNDMQREVVYATEGPVLILAGAGSGKTTVIVNRIYNMIVFGKAYSSKELPEGLTEGLVSFVDDFEKGKHEAFDEIVSLLSVNPVSPENILAITFTNKAADEMKSRLGALIGSRAGDIWASTFHSACVRILRREIENIGYKRGFTIYDADDSERVIKDVLKEQNVGEKSLTAKAVRHEISSAKDKMLTASDYRAAAGTDYRKQLIAGIYTEYEQRLFSANALDFDDIIMQTVFLFDRYPGILKEYQQRFKYILVDEYQDTNIAQYRLVEQLAREHHNLCVVGDDDQSIYRFRGATIENILSFEEQFNDARVFKLEQNYRSTKKILQAAHEVISNNRARKDKKLWTQNDDGAKIILHQAMSEQEEARFVADDIFEHIRQGKKFSDHAVLYRMNAQSMNFERAFMRAGIAYKIVGGLRFFDRMEIKDIIAYMSVVNNPADNLRLKRIINQPRRNIGDATVAVIEQTAKAEKIAMLKVIENVGKYPELHKKQNGLMGFFRIVQQLNEAAKTLPLDEFFDSMLEISGYQEYLLSLGEEGIPRTENVKELKSHIVSYMENTDRPELGGFLEEVALYTDLDSYDERADNVILMTMHAAKGLEFPYVYIAGMEDGIFPSKQAMFDTGDMEEERRLAYVGITRAKETLTLTHASSRLLFGTTSRNRLSQFAAEISGDLIEKTGITASPWGFGEDSGKESGKTYISDGKVQISSKPFAGSSRPKPIERDTNSYQKGDRIEHRAFGKGTVLTVTPLAGDMLIEIKFDSAGTKKIMANFAKLTKI